ncbi:hypothetical protein D7V96_17375, partial [bacterium D16-59]
MKHDFTCFNIFNDKNGNRGNLYLFCKYTDKKETIMKNERKMEFLSSNCKHTYILWRHAVMRKQKYNRIQNRPLLLKFYSRKKEDFMSEVQTNANPLGIDRIGRLLRGFAIPGIITKAVKCRCFYLPKFLSAALVYAPL